MNIIDRIHGIIKNHPYAIPTDDYVTCLIEALYECIMEDVKQLVGISDQLKEKEPAYTEHERKIDEMAKSVLRKGKV